MNEIPSLQSVLNSLRDAVDNLSKDPEGVFLKDGRFDKLYVFGDVLMFTEGEFADYKVHGIYVVLNSFNLRDILPVYLSSAEYPTLFDEFSEWLHREKYVVPINVSEILVGVYSDFNKEFYSKGPKS